MHPLLFPLLAACTVTQGQRGGAGATYDAEADVLVLVVEAGEPDRAEVDGDVVLLYRGTSLLGATVEHASARFPELS